MEEKMDVFDASARSDAKLEAVNDRTVYSHPTILNSGASNETIARSTGAGSGWCEFRQTENESLRFCNQESGNQLDSFINGKLGAHFQELRQQVQRGIIEPDFSTVVEDDTYDSEEETEQEYNPDLSTVNVDFVTEQQPGPIRRSRGVRCSKPVGYRGPSGVP